MKQLQVVIATLWFLSAWPAVAQDDIQARDWAASCTGCHGTDGRSVGGIPGLAGLDRDYIVAVMLEYKADKRPATVMHQHAKGYSDAQIERIAAFFAAQKR
jgi:cytochrome c553